MTAPPVIKEIVPKSGLLFQEITLHPVLCKPKIMPLKSVTLEKLEKMQKQAQDKALEMEKNQGRPSTAAGRPKTGLGRPEAERGDEATAGRAQAGEGGRPVSAKKASKADVWRADEEQQSAESGDD